MVLSGLSRSSLVSHVRGLLLAPSAPPLMPLLPTTDPWDLSSASTSSSSSRPSPLYPAFTPPPLDSSAPLHQLALKVTIYPASLRDRTMGGVKMSNVLRVWAPMSIVILPLRLEI